MKKTTIIFGLLFVLLIATNPSKVEYSFWLNDMISEDGFSLLSEEYIDKNTIENNYILFTIFESEFSDLGANQLMTIGILDNFIPSSFLVGIDYYQEFLNFLIVFVSLTVTIFLIKNLRKKKNKTDKEAPL